MPHTIFGLFLLALLFPVVLRINKWIGEKQINYINKRRTKKHSTQAAEAVTAVPYVRPARSPKVAACIRAIESDMLKRSLFDWEEHQVADLCSVLLQKALGDERIVIRLVEFEWTQSTDVIDAF